MGLPYFCGEGNLCSFSGSTKFWGVRYVQLNWSVEDGSLVPAFRFARPPEGFCLMFGCLVEAPLFPGSNSNKQGETQLHSFLFPTFLLFPSFLLVCFSIFPPSFVVPFWAGGSAFFVARTLGRFCSSASRDSRSEVRMPSPGL